LIGAPVVLLGVWIGALAPAPNRPTSVDRS
jgi:hypothetical protein